MVSLTALSMGLVAVGSGNPDIATQLLGQLMERTSELEMRDTYSKFLALGLALIYLGIHSAGVQLYNYSICIELLFFNSPTVFIFQTFGNT